jgi:hypothetical protein
MPLLGGALDPGWEVGVIEERGGGRKCVSGFVGFKGCMERKKSNSWQTVIGTGLANVSKINIE